VLFSSDSRGCLVWYGQTTGDGALCLDCSDVMAFTAAGAEDPAITNLSRDNARSAGHPMCRRVQIAIGDEQISIIEIQYRYASDVISIFTRYAKMQPPCVKQ